MSALVGFIHLATIFGLLLGTFGRFGLALNLGTPISRNQVIGQILMLGLCGLLAETGNDAAALVMPSAGSDNARALAAAGLALIASQATLRFAKASEDKLRERFPSSTKNQEPRQ